MNVRFILARCKAIFQRGSSWLDLVYSKFLMTVIFLKLFEDSFQGLGFSMIPLYIIGIILVIGACFTIGFIDLKRGIWLEENNTAWDYTPKAKRMMEQIDGMYTVVLKK
jgi:hypothetical protein